MNLFNTMPACRTAFPLLCKQEKTLFDNLLDIFSTTLPRLQQQHQFKILTTLTVFVEHCFRRLPWP